jgi:hypothetical protein
MSRRRFGSLGEARSHMLWMTAVFFTIGITLIFQPGRYSNTPAYGDLLEVLNPTAWGALYLAGAIFTALAFLLYRRRVLVTIAMFAGGVDALGWWLAFIERYATDSGTTIVNVVSWSTDLYLIIRCIVTLDDAPDETEVP